MFRLFIIYSIHKPINSVLQQVKPFWLLIYILIILQIKIYWYKENIRNCHKFHSNMFFWSYSSPQPSVLFLNILIFLLSEIFLPISNNSSINKKKVVINKIFFSNYNCFWIVNNTKFEWLFTIVMIATTL